MGFCYSATDGCLIHRRTVHDDAAGKSRLMEESNFLSFDKFAWHYGSVVVLVNTPDRHATSRCADVRA